jgi:hypothetical protein
MIELGKKDGQTAIQLGEGTMFKILDEYMSRPKEFKAKTTFHSFLAESAPKYF